MVHTLRGRLINNENVLQGVLTTGESDLKGTFGIVLTSGDVEIYDGKYEVTPKTVQQKLMTKQKLLTNDVTVFSVPYYEVSNTTGGTTVYIAAESDIE